MNTEDKYDLVNFSGVIADSTEVEVIVRINEGGDEFAAVASLMQLVSAEAIVNLLYEIDSARTADLIGEGEEEIG